MEMGHLLWPITQFTHDPNDPRPMTHDPWPLYYFILLMGLGGAWHGGTGQLFRSWKQTKLWIKINLIKPPAMIIGLIVWVSSFSTSTIKNKKMHVTGHLCHYHGSMGQTSMWPIRKWWPIWPMTHDPWPTDPFPSLLTTTLPNLLQL